jgi:predicted nucleic acid-binding protein
MAVLDASAVVEILLRTPVGLSVLEQAAPMNRHAPHLIDVEVMHTLRRLSRTRALSRMDSQFAVQIFPRIQLQRYGHLPLLPRVWELRDSLTSYDAIYVALAESLETPLFTCDAKLSRSHGHRAQIVLLQ